MYPLFAFPVQIYLGNLIYPDTQFVLCDAISSVTMYNIAHHSANVVYLVFYYLLSHERMRWFVGLNKPFVFFGMVSMSRELSRSHAQRRWSCNTVGKMHFIFHTHPITPKFSYSENYNNLFFHTSTSVLSQKICIVARSIAMFVWFLQDIKPHFDRLRSSLQKVACVDTSTTLTKDSILKLLYRIALQRLLK